MDFPVEYQAQINGEVSISYGDDTLLYKPVNCLPSRSLRPLHVTLIRLMQQHIWVPTYLFPFTVEGHGNDDALMVKCRKTDRPLSVVNGDWYYPKIKVRDSSTQRLYASGSFKKLVLSIVRTLVEFCNTPYRPLLDLQSMYIGVGENIIFTSFEERKPNHDWAYEVKDLSIFFNNLVKNRARFVTVRMELRAFCDWLRTTSYVALQRNIYMVFENVFFWNAKVRVMYVIQLQDYMEDGTSIFPICQNAFVDPEDSSSTSATVDFRERIAESKMPTLINLLAASDRHYKAKYIKWRNEKQTARPSIRRSNIVGTTVQARLEHGLTRIRDSFRHAFENTKERFTLEDIQHMYQSLFPIHMIEFAKVQHQISFNAVQNIESFLSAPPSSTMFS